ncbi:hypothetical protein AQ616_18425 [Oceanobacillus sp. E9]|uniref:hypothetical protein n=1 Tax=Oceanobacillus sp. E9 TaxID=1742575 RepID=UPI00084E39F3|nr:hypothetical protein [Oceanobacillus sp. E9]OEH53015.1 hypothetical protein AQ616_18425 [Oceanobacillus sp. E9]
MGGRPQKEWAIYKGDQFVFMGTTNECAKELGVHPDTIRFYSTPIYKKRLEKRGNLDNSTVVVDLGEVQEND